MTSEIESLSREFAKMAGHTLVDPNDAREVIRVMREREDYDKFVERIGGSVDWERKERNWWFAIPDKYIVDQTSLMLKEAVTFLKGKEANNAD